MPFSTTPLSFDTSLQGTHVNMPINLTLPETYQKLESLRYIFAADSVSLSSFKFSWWASKTHGF